LKTLYPDHDALSDESYPWYRVAAGCEESRSENDALIEKENTILQCLNGTAEAVDLWHLRDLALSRGGLVNSSIRKRAWPKLVGAHEQLFQSNRDTPVDISNTSMQLLMKDVLLSVWAIEDLIKLNRQNEEYRLSKMRPRKVSFVPDLMECTSTQSDGPSPIKSIDLVYTEAEKDNDNDHYSNGTYSPITVHTYDISSEISTTSLACKRMASKTEQKLLFNIITTVLRMPPAENPYFEDDSYSGLSDVAALLLINLESPSLVSLVMGQLARWHLRDSMRRNTIYIESTIQISLYPLLCTIDRELHSHITSCLSTPSFCLSWVQGWFCQCFRDVYVVSRLFDVFIVSHALMPM
jgi:Rab-GTPase-TBC domain